MSNDDSQVYPKTADSAINRHKERGTYDRSENGKIYHSIH